ncbi:hypothetical protein ES703_18431 [subsurface metagenome]
MRELKVGESYTGDELLEILGQTYDGGGRLYAFGNDEKVIVAQDEGNDNYEVLAVLDMPHLNRSQEKLFRHPPKCPTCEEPLTDIWGVDKYHITWQDGRWVKEEEASRLCCGKCQGDLDDADVEDIMREVGLL